MHLIPSNKCKNHQETGRDTAVAQFNWEMNAGVMGLEAVKGSGV